MRILRALEYGEFERWVRSDCSSAPRRSFAQRTAHCEKESATEKYREHLHHRLNDFTLLIPPLGERLGAAVRRHVNRVYEQTNRNQRRTAKLLGISRATLTRHLRKMAQ